MYVTLPTEQSVRTCLQTELAICILEQALYPVKHITWCVYALFIDDEECIRRDCKYSVTKVSGNRAISLGVSLGSKFSKTGTITGQMFGRNPCYRNTAPTTNSVFRKWLRGI